MVCSFQGCKNNAFSSLSSSLKECALHCEKGDYQNDKRKGILSDFFVLLKAYIASQLTQPSVSLFQNQNIDDVKGKDLFVRTNSRKVIIFENIHFPYRDNRDSYDYFRLLTFFKKIQFLDCQFYLGNWLLSEIEFFFQDCVFHNWFYLTPLKMLENDTSSLFSECEFKDKLSVTKSEAGKNFENSLFSGGKFSTVVILEEAEFKAVPFLELDEKSFANTTLKIFNCNFEAVVEFNKIILSSIWIDDVKFLSDFEITDSKVGRFQCINAEMHGVFNASESQFSYAKFERVNFSDVADFEKAKFGERDKMVIASYPVTAIFKFVTFMTASNFKNTEFYYGLDFENVDLREQPNFLKSNVVPYKTNRETFRIIKHSFDSRGNTLEANRFFVQEMKAFKKELMNERRGWDLLVYRVNDFLSEFGANYIRPIIILVVSVTIYTFIDYLHKCYFASHDYFIHKTLEPFWSFLNNLAKNFLPFSRFLANKSGLEFISLLFYIWFAILVWQIIVAVKRHTQR